MASLPTLLPEFFYTQTGNAWATTTVGNIDNGVATPSGTFIVADTSSTSSIFYYIKNIPANFVDMLTLNYNIRYKIESLSGDTETLFIRIWDEYLTTAYTNEETVATTTTNITITDKGSTGMTLTAAGLAASKADWEWALIEIRTTHSADMGSDGSFWSIDEVELTGTYGSPPTVSLNSPNLTFNYDTYYVDASISGPTDPDTNWENDANAFDGSTSTFANTFEACTESTGFLFAAGTNAPSSGDNIVEVKARFLPFETGQEYAYCKIYTSGLEEELTEIKYGYLSGLEWSPTETLSTPAGGWTWNKIQQLETKLYGDSDVVLLMYKVEIIVTSGEAITTPTPDFLFTGTDNDGEEIEYIIEIDSENSFDSVSTYAEYDELNVDTWITIGGGGSNITGVSQSIIPINGRLDTFGVWARKTGSPPGDASFSIYTDVGTFGSSSVPGELLGTQIRSANSVNSTPAWWINFFSSENILFDATERYCLVIQYTDGDASNYIEIASDSSIPTADGNQATETSSVWSAQSGSDLAYQVTILSPMILKKSEIEDADFSGTGDPHPWPSGNEITYTIQAGDALVNGLYYWRVKAKDPSGTNTYGDWSSTMSFDLVTGVGGAVFQLNIGVSWKDYISAKLNIGNNWKNVLLAKQNIGGVWKDVF